MALVSSALALLSLRETSSFLYSRAKQANSYSAAACTADSMTLGRMSTGSLMIAPQSVKAVPRAESIVNVVPLALVWMIRWNVHGLSVPSFPPYSGVG